MSILTVSEYVKLLNLKPHPEGGYYSESYRSSQHFEGSGEFPAGRKWATAIYFLIEKGNFSAFHRIKSDETWHFYAGDPLEVIEIDSRGEIKTTLVGSDIHNGMQFQYTVPAGLWFASRVYGEGNFSLVGCTVAPGFEYTDFELADRNALVASFPHHSNLISSLTR